MPNLCFYLGWDLLVTLCTLVRLGYEMLTHYLSCSAGSGAVYIISVSGHVTLNLCFYIQWGLRVT
jgi:hypothetical protein